MRLYQTKLRPWKNTSSWSPAIDAQLSRLRAAKTTGARRFIPSDFSDNIFALPEQVNSNSDWRHTFAERAQQEASGALEVVHVMQGIFTDRDVLDFLALMDEHNGVVCDSRDGTTPIDWSTWEDTALYTTAALNEERPLPAHLWFTGERADVLSFAKTWEAADKRMLKLERRSSIAELREEVQRRLTAEPSNVYAWPPPHVRPRRVRERSAARCQPKRPLSPHQA